MRAIPVVLCGLALSLGAGTAWAQHGPKHLCVVIDAAPGAVEYRNTCNHCVSLKLDLTNSDGDSETQTFEIPAKTSHPFDTSSYPRVRVPFVDVCAAEGDAS